MVTALCTCAGVGADEPRVVGAAACDAGTQDRNPRRKLARPGGVTLDIDEADPRGADRAAVDMDAVGQVIHGPGCTPQVDVAATGAQVGARERDPMRRRGCAISPRKIAVVVRTTREANIPTVAGDARAAVHDDGASVVAIAVAVEHHVELARCGRDGLVGGDADVAPGPQGERGIGARCFGDVVIDRDVVAQHRQVGAGVDHGPHVDGVEGRVGRRIAAAQDHGACRDARQFGR